MASVFNRGTKNNPRWYVKYRDADGTWKMRASRMPTKEQARRFVEAVEARIAGGLVGMPQVGGEEVSRAKITVRQLADRFTADYTSPRLKDPKAYRAMAKWILTKHALPSLGERAASQVTRLDLSRLRDAKLAAGLSKQSVRHVLKFLSKLYNWARVEGLVDCGNPVRDVEKPSAQDVDFDFLLRDEVEQLLAWSEVNQPLEHVVYATAVYTGMRKGELFGLRWIDVALDRALITVRRSYRSTPKSGKLRHVPINPRLLPLLRAWKEAGHASDEGLVFPTEKGGMRTDERGEAFRAALAGSGCHAVRLHDLRHTFASHFMMAGGNILTLQKLLGHSSVNVTMRYAHLAPDFMAAEVARMTFDRPMAGVIPIARTAG